MFSDAPSPAPRPRNASATRAAILDAARAAFTYKGYGSVGVRDVAAAAGVNAALVIRYFGSKEELFSAVVTDCFSGVDALLTGDRADFGERLARHLFAKEKGSAFDPLLLLLRSVANDETAGPLRDALDAQFVRPLAVWLGGDGATVRAGLIAAHLTGLSVLRDVLGSESLAEANSETLTALVAPVLQRYVDG